MITCITYPFAVDTGLTKKQKKAIYDKLRRDEFKRREVITVPAIKYCGACQTTKQNAEFHKSKSHMDGLAPHCKTCKHDYDAVYTQKNIAKKAAQSQKWAEENRLKVRQIKSKWKKNNPISAAASAHRRRCRIKASGQTVTQKDWEQICNRYGHICLCCGRSDVKLTMDHVLPVVLGGSHQPDNIQPLCQSCNAKKSAKYIDFRPDRLPIAA